MPEYIAKQGDCIESIAEEHGYFWETLWNHENNKELRSARLNPNVLCQDDVVFIPEKREKIEMCASEKRHRFRRKGVPSILRIVLKNEQDKPRANVAYTLEVDGTLFSGETDSKGQLMQHISPNAKRGKLTTGIGEEAEEQEFQLGYLDPISEFTGVQERLNNLGFDCGEIDGVIGPQTQEAIGAFQQEYKLEPTGKLDNATRQELKKQHGS